MLPSQRTVDDVPLTCSLCAAADPMARERLDKLDEIYKYLTSDQG